ncbi:transcription-repair coupling factor [Alphaproteobacteria bacterium]|nr:transcription-repair coupling factor [Alphaproteobacteria bacterium]
MQKQIFGCVEGAETFFLAQHTQIGKPLIYLSRDDIKLSEIKLGLTLFAPDIEVVTLPAWDCLPYDRVSPHGDITGERISSFSKLALQDFANKKIITLLTINSFLQKVPPKSFFSKANLILSIGENYNLNQIASFLQDSGFIRTNTVREYGEFAIRGDILDIFSEPTNYPYRLDFFGEELEKIRYFDSLSQLGLQEVSTFTLNPVAEYSLTDDDITRFRKGYISLFGANAAKDQIYEEVTAGRTPVGIEHWLSLLHPEMNTIFDWLPNASLIAPYDFFTIAETRCALINEFYDARLAGIGQDSFYYRPVPPEQMYLQQTELENLLKQNMTLLLSPFVSSEIEEDSNNASSIKGKTGPVFSASQENEFSPSQSAAKMIQKELEDSSVILVASSQGAVVKLTELIAPHLSVPIAKYDASKPLIAGHVYCAVWSLSNGFMLPNIWVLTEQDIFGARQKRPAGRRKRSDEFLREVSSLQTDDLVVHIEHGIGRYDGLETIESGGSQHDCLRLIYAGGDRLYIPVENIDLLSRYGQQASDAALDRLGGAAWQAKKARIKGKIREMADQLIKIAANRQVSKAERLNVPTGIFDEFCARFPFAETDDQLDAISDVIEDLGSGKPTDRLICGDVGFGKTEVALRAAFVASMSGYQVALVTPTTLLARQHGKVFEERFKGFPIQVRVLSRMTTSKNAAKIKQDVADGTCQMVIGTHALLAKSMIFNNLGLLIVDEEQHFGVAQKEQLKLMRADMHVLTLSATPIPRTLQMALSGVREMSLIATPPVDRLAVRTFVGPWDSIVLREAIMREKQRGGQIFVVCPRIKDMQKLFDRITSLVPEASILSAHGQMNPPELDQVMTDFADAKADILLSTHIVESGIDIPTANTMIIHRADRFGLSQLYQLRGRVGRGKQRAYAYLTTDPQITLTSQAKRRLEVMQTLDKLGAGFSLASYDMDIRGAGNLLGDEQSGHVKEVGIELYQDMLRQAVALSKSVTTNNNDLDKVEEDNWSPLISMGTDVLIPDDYIQDLTVRLSLYRKIASVCDFAALQDVKVELTDRFGPIPDKVNNLLQLVELKQICKKVNIDKIDAGNKGFSIQFRGNEFSNPEKLIAWIASQKDRIQLRADHKLIIKQDLTNISKRADFLKAKLLQIEALKV